MPIKNLILATTLQELPVIADLNAVAFLENDFSNIYVFDGGWSPRAIVPPIWPVGAFYTMLGDTDPSTVLNVGRWECVKKEEIGTEVFYSWVRRE
jgi:hypothetical protein